MPTPLWKHYTALIESPKSGALKLSDRGTWTFVYTGTAAHAYVYALAHPRGTSGTVGGYACYVDDCSVETERGGQGTVTCVWARLDILPPDDFSITAVENNPAIERNPYFAALTSNDLNLAKKGFQAASLAGATSLEAPRTTSANAALILSLGAKWLRGAETYYLAGLKYTWTKYYSDLTGVPCRLGGYRAGPGSEFPSAPGVSLLPSGAWLRQCDDLSWNNGSYKLTRSWVWGPADYWDTDLYGTSLAPLAAALKASSTPWPLRSDWTRFPTPREPCQPRPGTRLGQTRWTPLTPSATSSMPPTAATTSACPCRPPERCWEMPVTGSPTATAGTSTC